MKATSVVFLKVQKPYTPFARGTEKEYFMSVQNYVIFM